MRIIGGDKDYYDGCQSVGYDPNLLYLRKFQQFNDDIEPAKSIIEQCFQVKHTYGNSIFDGWQWSGCAICPVLVGFCGKVYLGLQYVNIDDSIRFIAYDFETFNLNVDKKFSEIFSARKMYFRNISSGNMMDQIKYYFNLNNKPSKNIDNIFSDLNSPIFTWMPSVGDLHPERKYRSFCVNSNLANLEFYRIMNPWQCYQEIAMYLGGVLCSSEKNNIKIEDNIMRDMKGFDNRSFKMDSPGKKKKRRNK